MKRNKSDYIHKLILNDELSRLSEAIAALEIELTEKLQGEQLILFNNYKNTVNMKMRFFSELTPNKTK